MTTNAPAVVLRPATSAGGSDESWQQAWTGRGRTALLPDLSPAPGLVVLESPGLTVLLQSTYAIKVDSQ